MNFIKLLSFIYPVKVYRTQNQFHTLEIEWYNGKLMLNSEHANYSFGNLQEVFRMAFRDSGLQIAKQGKVLLLGLGGGCVIDLLEQEYNFRGNVKAVDIDPEVIKLYRQYFSGNRLSQTELLEGGATELDKILKAGEQYDLIICDLFIDLTMPHQLSEPDFYIRLKKYLKPGGTFYLNSISSGETNKQSPWMLLLGSVFREVRKLSYFDLNEVYVTKWHFVLFSLVKSNFYAIMSYFLFRHNLCRYREKQ